LDDQIISSLGLSVVVSDTLTVADKQAAANDEFSEARCEK
jgi:hypothetical protein